MRITTWNVNGLRAALTKPEAVTWLAEFKPDVLCLQEIKAKPEQVDPELVRLIAGPEECWHSAERPGYSGVATFARQAPQNWEVGLGEPRFDREGRAILAHFPDFVLINVYVTNGKRDHSRVPEKLDFYAALLKRSEALRAQGKEVIICGDINTAHQEIDLRNPRQNQNTSGFLPEEREWISRFVASGYQDAYRLLYPERAEYTWWAYFSQARERNVGWRLDYFLVSTGLMPKVGDVTIHGDVPGSDHCPVTLEISAS